MTLNWESKKVYKLISYNSDCRWKKDTKVTDAWKGLSWSHTLQINSFHVTDERLLSIYPKTHTQNWNTHLALPWQKQIHIWPSSFWKFCGQLSIFTQQEHISPIRSISFFLSPISLTHNSVLIITILLFPSSGGG